MLGVNSTIVVENITTRDSFQQFCEHGICGQLVELDPIKDSRFYNKLAVDVIYLIIVPTVLWYISCILWNVYNTSRGDPNCTSPLPPGSFGLPFIGETFHLLISSRFFTRRRRIHGNIFKTHILGRPTIRITGSEAVKQILRGENYMVTTQWPASTGLLLGEGSISFATGDTHCKKKRCLMKAFTFRALSDYTPAIQAITRSYIHKWCRDGNILAYPEFRTLNFSLSCRVLAGLHLDYKEASRLMRVFEAFASNIFSVPIDVPGSGFRKAMNAKKVLLEKIGEVVKQREAVGDSAETDLLGVIMNSKDSDNLTNSELQNLCLELLFAGHGTTSSAASFLVCELTKHPEICSRLKQEMTSLGLDIPGSDGDFDLITLNKMSLLNNVVKETLRLSPPIGGGFRRALKTFVIEGFQVPEGWSVIYGITDTHETCNTFTDPDMFDPDRWNLLDSQEPNFGYLPFGGGKRACAGKDLAKVMLKVFVIELLRGCRWSHRNVTSEFKRFPMPHPTDNLPLKIEVLQATAPSSSDNMKL